MNKKLIEVLEMIAQGEQIKFICDGYEYHTDEVGRILNKYDEFVEWYIYKNWLNEEVEIIEEVVESVEEKKRNSKKIENISDEELEECDCDYDRICLILDRLDEIIDYINKGQDNEDI